MPIKTDLESSPYFDDYDENNDYYRILFKPSVPVQVRELNQLQSIVQKQIERFGDNIFKRGTIVDGCAFTFHDNVPYIKIKDIETDSSPVSMDLYVNQFIKDPTSNLQAYIISSNTGFETQDPDLNTLHLKYLNSGTGGELTFSSNNVLTIFDANNSVYEVSIINGGITFANTDSPLFLSAITVQNSVGGISFTNSTGSACTFSVGQTITGGSSNAQAVILEANTTANSEGIVLKIRPVFSDLTASPANTAKWTFAQNETINIANGVINAKLSSVIGSGATATIATDGSGKVTTMTMLNRGNGYYVPPYVNIISSTGTPSILDIVAENYIAKITVSSLANSVGTGYGFSISNGVIYQLGYFSRVDEQYVIVEKYSNTPAAKAVGFNTAETLINSNIDQSLLDNALGSFNYTAPGADRLKLTPTLIVVDKVDADANNDFFSIVEFSDGKPYKQNRFTAYDEIADEMARRTFEESGNYVLDNFIVNTVSANNMADEATEFDVVIDPGRAYINGYRVETSANYRQAIQKSTDTVIANSVSISVNYGNYIRVKNVAGVFLFSTGDTISLRNTTKEFLANGSNFGTIPTGASSEIGTARIRSMTYESGIPGSKEAVYRLYLFDIQMSDGKNFRDVRSVFYDGADFDAVADIILNVDPTSGVSIAQLQETANNKMMFYAGADAIKTVNSVTYTYRTIDQTSLTANTSGKITITLAGTESHPYLNELTSNELEDIIVIPLANLEASAAVTGTVTVSTTTPNVVGSGTTFLSDFEAGDYVSISANSTGGSIYRRVASVTNSTHMVLDSNSAFANSTATLTPAFPQYIPVPLSTRTGRGANVDVSGQILVIDLNETLASSANVAVAYNVKVTNASPITKQAQRDLYVRIDCSNTNGSTIGPWCLGVTDIFRLKNVYKGPNNTFISSDTGVQDVTRHFLIDHNQDENAYNVGYLYINPNDSLSLSGSDRLLVKFDAFSNNLTNTVFSIASYTIDDTLTLENLTTNINTVEIPEMVTSTGEDVDLRDQFDFRPISVNTAVITTNPASATVHPLPPSRSAKFGNTANPANDQKFPAPVSDLIFNVESYLSRKDLVVISSNGEFNIIKGTPDLEPADPKVPADALVIELLNIEPYPSLPEFKSANTTILLNKRIINQKLLADRENTYRVKKEAALNPVKYSQTPAFTMQDIQNLKDRIEQLEYYSTLSLIEDKVKEEVIPSSANNQTNRFKFGYFVDNFTTENYADLNDIEFKSATNKERSRLVPAFDHLNLKYKIYFSDTNTANTASGKMLLLPYDSVSVVSQLQATTPTTVTVTAPTTITTTTPVATPPLTYNQGRFISKMPNVLKATQYQEGLMFAAGFGIPVYQGTTQKPKYLTGDQSCAFTITGLRPNTTFYFMFDKINSTSNCRPVGKKIGDPLVSNSSGVLEFTLYLSTQEKESLLTAIPSWKVGITQFYKAAKSESKTKLLELREGSTTGRIVATDQLTVSLTALIRTGPAIGRSF